MLNQVFRLMSTSLAFDRMQPLERRLRLPVQAEAADAFMQIPPLFHAAVALSEDYYSRMAFFRRPRANSAHALQGLWQVVSAYKWRVAGALVFLILAKVATVSVPLVLKRIVDELSRPEQISTLPVLILAGYAVLRFSSTLFNELRDLLFARVTQQTVATYAHKVFTHLHDLGSRFHAQRRIGGLLPDIERGTNGIAFLLGIGLFTLVPTLAEIGMVLTIMGTRYSLWYTGIISATFVLYTGFTVAFTTRHTIFQRRVNRLDSSAKSHLTDSLMNYDSVKYFTNEQLDSRRFQDIMKHWADAATDNQKALFVLHVGQSAVIALGVSAIMLLAGNDVMSGRMTVGDPRAGGRSSVSTSTVS